MQNSFFEIFSTCVNIVDNNALWRKKSMCVDLVLNLTHFGGFFWFKEKRIFEELCNTRDIHNYCRAFVEDQSILTTEVCRDRVSNTRPKI